MLGKEESKKRKQQRKHKIKKTRKKKERSKARKKSQTMVKLHMSSVQILRRQFRKICNSGFLSHTSRKYRKNTEMSVYTIYP